MLNTSGVKYPAALALVIALCVLNACREAHDPRTDDVTTGGHVLILADEDLRDLV